MKNIKRENKFIVIWIICVFLLIGACNIGFIRGTRAGFGPNGDISGSLEVKYILMFHSNDSSNQTNKEYINVGDNYSIPTYMLTISNGYEFVNWNTAADGSGITYNVGDSIYMDSNKELYAQWNIVPDSGDNEGEDNTDNSGNNGDDSGNNEDNTGNNDNIGSDDDNSGNEIPLVPSYGDVNGNGSIDDDDASLIEYYLNGVIKLSEQSLLNADVNNDGKVDLVDIDIVKQVILGTEGYTGYLPNNSIPVYDIYKGDSSSGDADMPGDNPSGGDAGTGDDNNNEDSSGNGSSSGGNNTGGDNSEESGDNGSGTGSSGSGTDSSGKGENGNTTDGGTGNGKPSSGSGQGGSNKPNSSGGNNNVTTDKDKVENDKDDEGTNDKENDNKVDSEIVEDEENKDETEDDKKDDTELEEQKPKSYVYIVVLGICLLSLRLIFYVIKKFKEKNNLDEIENDE